VLNAMACLVELGRLGWTRRDRYLNVTPIFHGGSWTFTLMAIMNGNVAGIVRRFNAERVLKAIERLQMTFTWMAPTMLRELANEAQATSAQPRSLRILGSAAAPITPETWARVKGAFPMAHLCNLLGQTEQASVVMALTDPEEIQHKGPDGSVGRPVLGVEAMVVDEAGGPVAPGTVGELVTRSAMLLREYYRKPAETAAAFQGGWFHTGDLVRQDEDGCYYVVDRKKDIIISGGENISSVEVEAALLEHAEIAEVAVVGVPDPHWGEAVKAFVVPRSGSSLSAEAVIAFARTRLSAYKVPKAVEMVESLPRNAVGKIVKRTLRDA